MLTTLLDLLGLGCLVALAWIVWPPLVLAVVGVSLLAASRRLS